MTRPKITQHTRSRDQAPVVIERGPDAAGDGGSEDIFNSSAMGLLEIGPDGALRRVNKVVLELLGCEDDGLPGGHIADLFYHRADAHELMRRLARGETVRDHQVRLRRRDGAARHLLVNADAVWRRDKLDHARCFLRDTPSEHDTQRSLQARVRQQRMLANLGQYALTEPDVQRVFERAVTDLAGTLEVEYCKVLELLPDGAHMLLRAGVGWRKGLVGRGTVDTGPNSQAGFTLANHDPIIVEDLRVETRFTGPPLLVEHGVISGMSCVIEGPGDRPWGVLGVHATSKMRFTSDDINLLQAASNVLSSAIIRRSMDEALHDAHEMRRLALEAASLGTWDWNPATGEILWDERCREIFATRDTPGIDFDTGWEMVVEGDRPRVEEAIRLATDPGGHGMLDSEHRIRRADGSIRWVAARGQTFFDQREGEHRAVRCIGTLADITDRKASEFLVSGQKHVLEMMAEGATLESLLDTLVRTVESLSTREVFGSILLRDGDRLRHGAAPHLPEAYNQAVDGVPIGPSVGSCGTAAHRQEAVVVTDIATDPLWADYKELALEHGLHACWSTPIIGSSGDVLGTFAVYSRQPQAPDQGDEDIVRLLGRTAAIAIERTLSEEALKRSEQLYRAIGESINYGVWVCDPEGRNTYLSQSFLDLTGLSQEECSGFGWTSALHPDDMKATLEAWQETVRAAESWQRELRIKSADGAWHHVLARGVPIRDEASNVLCWAGINLDIRALKAAENALRESEEQRRLALQSAALGTWDHDLVRGTLFWDRRTRNIFGVGRDEPISVERSLEVIVPEDRKGVEAAIRRAVDPAGSGDFDMEYRVKLPSGEHRWVAALGKAHFRGSGASRRAVRFIGTVQDFNERKHHEERMQMVMAELNHRVKNTLAVVSSMANQTMRQASDLESFRRSFTARLGSLGDAHGLLTRAQWEGARVHDVLDLELRSRVAAPDRYELEGNEVMLGPSAALALHMVIHELSTNAAKYGALSEPTGHVSVRWHLEQRDDMPWLRLEWVETGGPPVKPPRRSGFGSTVVRQTIPYELDGEVDLDFAPEGFRCRIAFPWSSRTSDRHASFLR